MAKEDLREKEEDTDLIVEGIQTSHPETYVQQIADNEKIFKCRYLNCQASFRRKDKLDIHYRLHTGERPFVCTHPGCDKQFIRSQHLVRHEQRVHYKSQTHSRLLCDNCGEDFANSTSLHRHINSVHNPKKAKLYKCPEAGCEEVFHKKNQLLHHRIAHTGHLNLSVKVIKCPFEGCDKSFTFPSNLKRHMKVHKGYACDVEGCEEILSTWSKLRKHKADVHTSKKCTVCGAVFKQKSSLDQHRKTHDETREAVVCPVEGCGRIYFYNKNLRQHIRAFHQGEGVWKKKKKEAKSTEKKQRKPRPKKSAAAKLFGLDDRKPILWDECDDNLRESMSETHDSESISSPMDTTESSDGKSDDLLLQTSSHVPLKLSTESNDRVDYLNNVVSPLISSDELQKPETHCNITEQDLISDAEMLAVVDEACVIVESSLG